MENNTVIGHTSYKGLIAQQHPNFYPILKNFLSNVRPSQVLEIGTAGGGFTLAIRDILNEIGLESSSIKSFEVIDQPQYEELRNKNIEVNIENIFDHSYFNLEKPEKIVPYIQNKGVTVVFCDGGHKKGEFSMISPYLKTGDYILAHDYIDTLENFENYFKGKIWNWREVGEEDLIETAQKENLVPSYQEEFSKIVWACKQKQ